MHIPPAKPAKRNLLSAILKKKAPPLPPRISDARRRIEMQKQAKFHLARHDALMNRIRHDDQLHARRQRQQMALQIPKRAPINIRPQPTQAKQYQPRYTPLPQPPTRRPDNSRRLVNLGWLSKILLIVKLKVLCQDLSNTSYQCYPVFYLGCLELRGI